MKNIRRIFSILLSTAMLGSVLFAAPAAAVNAVGDDDPAYPENMDHYVYDNDMLMLDPDEKHGTINILRLLRR